jgi:hypothetical protein
LKTLLSLLLLSLSVQGLAQATGYLADLAALKAALSETPSYKAQIRGQKEEQYLQLYNRLAADSAGSVNSYTYFYRLAQLLFPLRDNHLAFYQLPDYARFRTRESIDSYVASAAFLDYPHHRADLDSLQAALAARPADSVEGIYHYHPLFTVGLFRSAPTEYIGVILSSTVNFWRRGQIAIHLYEQAPNRFKAIYGHPLHKGFMLQPVEKFVNGSLVNAQFYGPYAKSIYTKAPGQPDRVNLPTDAPLFAFRNISSEVQYLLVRTFQNSAAAGAASQRFHDSVKNLLTAPHLILDLRNNEGGAERQRSRYLSLAKEHVKKGQLYVLVNNGTLSQAELFVLELKRLPNVTILGQTTMGMLSYGSNFGKRVRLPSGRFELYPTDMKGSAVRLAYEDVGITPDLFLSAGQDWIEQVLALINK